MSIRRTRSANRPPSTMSAGADLILDAALKEASHDRFDHEAIARVVADLAVNAPPPINVALFGPWGSGKSSFFGLLNERLAASGQTIKVARYDAWKYGGRALKKHFVGSVAEQLGFGGDDFERSLAHDQEVVRLDLRSWVKQNRSSLIIGALLACAITFVWFVFVSFASWFLNLDAGLVSAMRTAVEGVGAVLSLSFAALLIGPKILESAVVKFTNSAPETDDEFAKSFQRLVDKAIKTNRGERLVVFIDELDRCSPKDVVATLIDLKTFLDIDGCVFIVAADREVLERALQEVPQANPVRDEDPYYSTPGAFLDKVFQHQIPLPPLRAQALTRFARELVETQGGLWADLRKEQRDDRLFLRVVYGLVPVHVRSPRRVKVLLNNYATNVRIAEARGVNWIARAEELATLTVLETEFPSVAADLIRFPSLLKYLRNEEAEPQSESARATVDSYRSLLREVHSASGSDAPVSAVAGDLLVDSLSDKVASRRANKVLVENLLAYLRKIEASGIDDPRPDLLYLQSAGAEEGIDDPGLAEIIDFASDYSADDVVRGFSGQTSAVVATAVRLLAQQADAERGPGRMAITETVCRLTERLDPVDAQAVAPLVAGTVLAEAGNLDWPDEATPGALILGVIGASQPLVQALLGRQDADAMARSGALGRIASVLTYANDAQAALVYTLLGAAYYAHPEALHGALANTPPVIAEALWDNTCAAVESAFKRMAAPATAPAANTPVPRAAAAAATSDLSPRPTDTTSDRFEALLTAVESRTDSQSERLISNVLTFGQGAGDAQVRATASDLAESAIARISTPVLLNQHAMLGLRYSPLAKAVWWADLLTETESAPHGHGVFERLVDALTQSDEKTTVGVVNAISAVIPHVPKDELPLAGGWVRASLGKTAWSVGVGASTVKNRAAIFKVAEAVRPWLTSEGASELDEVLASDLVDALDEGITEAHVSEMLTLAMAVPASVAAKLETQAAERVTNADDVVPTLRLRIAAAARGSGVMLAASEVLAVRAGAGAKDAFAEWLGLNPSLPEAQEVLGHIPIYTNVLDRYAAGLDLVNRTALWVGLDSSGRNWPQSSFEAIGKHGLNSAAVEHIAKGVAAATQQSLRDARIDRLEAAKLVENPQHKAATELVLQLSLIHISEPTRPY